MGLKVENRKVRKELDVQIVTAKTIEGLMMFLGIQPDENKKTMN